MTNKHLEKTVTVAPLTSHLWAIATQPLVWWMEGTAHKQQALVIRDILGKLLSSGSDHVLIINHEIIWIYGMVSLPIHRCSSCMNHRYPLQPMNRPPGTTDHWCWQPSAAVASESSATLPSSCILMAGQVLMKASTKLPSGNVTVCYWKWSH